MPRINPPFKHSYRLSADFVRFDPRFGSLYLEGEDFCDLNVSRSAAPDGQRSIATVGVTS
jgi:hypothetical protein